MRVSLWPFRRTRSRSGTLWEPSTSVGMEPRDRETRQYLVDCDYQLPKDEEEKVRLNFQHYALYYAIGTHYVAPIDPPPSLILDVGTGTGIWANEIARLFPTSFVIGVDLSAASFTPPSQENCLLRLGNVLTGLPFPDALFEYTHQRLLVAGITAENWPPVMRELVRVTRVNGWIECVEVDNQMQNAGPATASMLAFMEGVSRSLGFGAEVIRHLGDLLEQEGVEAVERQTIRIPVGEWAGRVGSLMKQDLLAVTNALKGRYCAQAGITEAAFDQMAHAMAAEWEDCRPSCTFYAVYGRKGHL